MQMATRRLDFILGVEAGAIRTTKGDRNDGGTIAQWGRICPGCGERVVAPNRSEFVSERLVLNHWSCMKCGNWFETAWTPDTPERRFFVARTDDVSRGKP